MSGAEARDKVLEEFTQGLFIWERPGERQYRMADEIVRQRQRLDRAERILAALREPSDPLIDRLCDVHEVETETERCFVIGIIRMAVAAAEREVDG